MISQMDKERLTIILVLLVALIFFAMTQSNPPIFILLPIILFTLGICWYLYHEIKKDHQQDLKRGIHRMQDEKEAQIGLHKSFVPQVRRLAKKLYSDRSVTTNL
jgi:cbb3-type cytochrome oxidase subunit 3